MRNFNAKPMLVASGVQYFRGDNYLEIDIPKFQSNSIMSKFNIMQLQIGIVIEGRDDHELPEVFIGLVGINKIQDKLCRVIKN
jgi:hypothetical protein